MTKTRTFSLFSFYEEGKRIQIQVRVYRSGSFESKGKINIMWNPGYLMHAKERGLRFKPLSFWHEGCDFHHINKENVIAVPAWIHEAIQHTLKDGTALRLEGVLG